MQFHRVGSLKIQDGYQPLFWQHCKWQKRIPWPPKHMYRHQDSDSRCFRHGRMRKTILWRHLRRHLEFWREHKVDSSGLLICCLGWSWASILKNPACYQFVPGLALFKANTTGLLIKIRKNIVVYTILYSFLSYIFDTAGLYVNVGLAYFQL